MTDKERILHTRLCDILGIKYPILLAGMGLVGPEPVASSTPELAAAVSNAGGLGVVGCTGTVRTPDDMRAVIRKVKSLTDKPFGMDLLLPSAMKDAPPPGMPIEEARAKLIPEGHRKWAQELVASYNVPFRPVDAYATEVEEEWSKAMIQVVVEEKVPVFASAIGIPEWLVPMCHSGGTKVIGLSGNVRHALRHKAAGADIIQAQGHEAGGHTGRIGTMAVVPQIVDAVAPVPVLAAGGIADGRALVAALALGAAGVWVGTVFLFAEESGVMELHKKQLTQADEESTEITRWWTGKTARFLKNPLQEAFTKSGLPPLPLPLEFILSMDVANSLQQAGRIDLMGNPAGQIVGMLKEVKPAKQIVDEMVEGAVKTLEALHA